MTTNLRKSGSNGGSRNLDEPSTPAEEQSKERTEEKTNDKQRNVPKTEETFDNPNDYNHESYAKLMQEDDVKSTLHWKGAAQSKNGTENGTGLPEFPAMKVEEPTVNGVTETPVATKLISEVTRREIVARDANRFHVCTRFPCSCHDCW